MDSSWAKVVKSHGRNRYTLIVRDDFQRYTWVYLMRHKSDDAETFKQLFSDTRPSQVVTVGFDGSGEFCGGKFGDLCRSRLFQQEFPTADSPQSHGGAERALGLIETAATAG